MIVCQKHRPMGPVEKGKHVVFVGFSYGAELMAQVRRVNSVIPNDRFWLVVPRLKPTGSKRVDGFGRHLIISEPDIFLKDIFSCKPDLDRHRRECNTISRSRETIQR